MVFSTILGTTMTAANIVHVHMRTIPETEYEEVKCTVRKIEGKLKAQSTEVKYDGKQEWRLGGALHRSGKPAVEYYDKDVLRAMEYYQLGKFHNGEGPARKVLNSDGTTLLEEHYFEGELHRSDGPAVVQNHPNGKIYMEKMYEFGKLHHWGKPAIVVYNTDGKPIVKEWYMHDKKHRYDAPAVKYWYDNGDYKHEYYELGRLHRDHVPAVIIQFQGEYRCEYYQRGKLHRDHGPAVVDIDDFGQRHEEYYLNGRQYSKIGYYFAKAGLWW
tara:strand:- start:7381 stop:8193 length:813 start_codon:yes stop_codon:yes gene_type:complete